MARGYRLSRKRGGSGKEILISVNSAQWVDTLPQPGPHELSISVFIDGRVKVSMDEESFSSVSGEKRRKRRRG